MLKTKVFNWTYIKYKRTVFTASFVLPLVLIQNQKFKCKRFYVDLWLCQCSNRCAVLSVHWHNSIRIAATLISQCLEYLPGEWNTRNSSPPFGCGKHIWIFHSWLNELLQCGAHHYHFVIFLIGYSAIIRGIMRLFRLWTCYSASVVLSTFRITNHFLFHIFIYSVGMNNG